MENTGLFKANSIYISNNLLQTLIVKDCQFSGTYVDIKRIRDEIAIKKEIFARNSEIMVENF
jgi:hypothetical protein